MATEVQAVELTEEMMGASATREREALRKQAKPKAAGSRLGYRAVKRAFDIVASLCALVLLSPVFLIVAIAIRLDSKGPVVFKQPRFGRAAEPFSMYKFRSMCPDAEEKLRELTPEQKKEFAENFKLEDDPRITRVGRFVRKTSLDELPQLWNVLIGDMSLVGPRPPLLSEKEAYGTHLGKVMSVRPGVTGYWQVHGRSDTAFSERISMNEYYIENRGLRLDGKILFQTVAVILKCKGAK